MLKDNIQQELADRYSREDGLTISMMLRAIDEFDITDPAVLDVIYEPIMFFTGDWPEHQGWQSSDTSALLRSVKESLQSGGHLKNFKTGLKEAVLKNQWASAYTDTKGILRWCINDAIPLDDMLADFRSLGLIDEDVQLGSNLLREQGVA